MNHLEKTLDKVDVYKEVKNETCLQELFGQYHVQKASLFAVILDITPNFQTEKDSKHALKIKIIDDSFNANVLQKDSSFKFQKFAHLIFLSS